MVKSSSSNPADPCPRCGAKLKRRQVRRLKDFLHQLVDSCTNCAYVVLVADNNGPRKRPFSGIPHLPAHRKTPELLAKL
jgi:hypothetical protein